MLHTCSCCYLHFFLHMYVHVDEYITQGGIFCLWGGFEKSRLIVVKGTTERERKSDGDDEG